MTTNASSTYSLWGANSTYIKFDNTEYAILREDLEGLSTYPVDYDVAQTPGVIGTRVANTSIGEREISFSVLILGDGRAELEQRRQKLIKALNPLLGYGMFFWHREDGSTYYLLVRPDSDTPSFDAGTAHNAQSWLCSVTLICHDPCWHNYNIQTHTLVGAANGFHLPFQMPFTFGIKSPVVSITNPGTAPAPVTILALGKILAPIVITNQTTGESITVRKNVLLGDSLIIDTDRSYLHVTHIDGTTGTETNALSYCSVGSKFWQLAIGENKIKVTSGEKSSEAYMSLTFRERQVAL